jgi:hypothetical protein
MTVFLLLKDTPFYWKETKKTLLFEVSFFPISENGIDIRTIAVGPRSLSNLYNLPNGDWHAGLWLHQSGFPHPFWPFPKDVFWLPRLDP